MVVGETGSRSTETIVSRGDVKMLQMRPAWNAAVIFLLATAFLPAAHTRKLQSWLGTNIFVKGAAPAGRATGQLLSELRGNLYVFGGSTGTQYLNTLNIFFTKSRAWVDLSDKVQGAPPTARYAQSFHAIGGKLYVFGGRSSDGGYLNDLHEFDPQAMAWSNLSPQVLGDRPSPRCGATLAHVGGRLFLFGGWDQITLHFFNNLFALDPTSPRWDNLTAKVGGEVPPLLSGHCFAAIGSRLYVFSGALLEPDGSVGHSSGLWAIEPEGQANWIDLTAKMTGPSPWRRKDGAMSAAEGRLYLYGGWSDLASPPWGGVLRDLWVYDPPSNLWTDLSLLAGGNPPPSRAGHSLIASPSSSILYAFGGYTDWPVMYRADLFSLTVGASNTGQAGGGGPGRPVWTDLSSVLNQDYMPPVSSSSTQVVAGGQTVTTVTTVEMLVQLNPEAAYHGLAAVGSRLFLFAGSTDTGERVNNQLFAWDDSTLQWSNLTAASPEGSNGGVGGGGTPAARRLHGFASAGGALFVFGGLGVSGLLNDMHRYDPNEGTWAQLPVTDAWGRPGPPARKGHGLAAAGAGALFTFGGLGDHGCLGDLWRYNITPPPSPAAPPSPLAAAAAAVGSR